MQIHLSLSFSFLKKTTIRRRKGGFEKPQKKLTNKKTSNKRRTTMNMKRCYCGQKMAEWYAREIDFKEHGSHCISGLRDTYNAMFDDDVYNFDVGLGILFCSEGCISEFLYDYVREVKKINPQVSTYDMKFYRGFFKFGKPANLYVYLYDEDGEQIERLYSRDMYGEFKHFNKDIVDYLYNFKIKEYEIW